MSSSNPVLLEVTRGGRVESQHRGRFCVFSKTGDHILHTGACDADVYPRSCMKPLQAAAMLELIGPSHESLTLPRIAIGAGSHDGLSEHTHLVKSWLEEMGLDSSYLRCGLSQPYAFEAQQELSKSSKAPSLLHNNCSGKHAMMLQSCLAMGVATKDYIEPDHPLQKSITDFLSDWVKVKLGSQQRTVDGCGIPLYAMPLSSLARAYASFGMAAFSVSDESSAIPRRIFSAISENPDMIAGPKRLCSRLTALFAGKGISKLGAQGVYIVSSSDYAFALKVDDGSMQAAEILAALIARSLSLELDFSALEDVCDTKVKSLEGVVVGSYRPSAHLQDLLGTSNEY